MYLTILPGGECINHLNNLIQWFLASERIMIFEFLKGEQKICEIVTRDVRMIQIIPHINDENPPY